MNTTYSLWKFAIAIPAFILSYAIIILNDWVNPAANDLFLAVLATGVFVTTYGSFLSKTITEWKDPRWYECVGGVGMGLVASSAMSGIFLFAGRGVFLILGAAD